MSIAEKLVQMAEQLHGPEHGPEQSEKIESAILRSYKPTIEQLAMIAAQLLPRHDGDCQAAISEAARLWVACVREHGKLGKRDWRYNQSQGVTIPKPQKFPVTFIELLKLLMPQAKGESERMRRLRQYFAEMPKTNGWEPVKDAKGNVLVTGKDWAAERIAEQRHLELGETAYCVFAHSFLAWWNSSKSEMRRQAGKRAAQKKSD